MCKKHQELPIHQFPHPPFPSISWVMTAEANPPSPAYAYGYIRNAHAHTRPRPRPPAHNGGCLPVRRSLPPGLHEYPPSHPRSSTKPPPSPTSARTAAISTAKRSSEKFMETVDYRSHDPPSRPCVPWLEGYTLPRRGASGTQPQVPYQDSEELALPPFPITEPPTASSRCRFAGSANGFDDARPKKKKRTRTRTMAGESVDVVKINRLGIVLGALRRACGLSAKEGPCRASS